MAKQKTTTNTPAQWGPAECHRSETPKGKTFTAYAACPFDRIWGLEQWGYEIQGSRETGILKDEDDKDREVPVVRLTGSLPRKTTYVEPDRPGWTLPAGLTLSRPFSEAGEALLQQMHLVDEYADTFRLLPDVLRGMLLTECGVAPERLPRLTGPEIEDILRRYNGAPSAAKAKHEDTPDDLVTFDVAQTMFTVSRPTLQRAVDDGTLESYRRSKRGKHLASVSDLKRLYPPRN